MDIFLTGGTGFIGSYLVEQLVKDGHNLTCLVRPTSDIKRLVELGLEMVEGSVTDIESMRNAMKDTVKWFMEVYGS